MNTQRKHNNENYSTWRNLDELRTPFPLSAINDNNNIEDADEVDDGYEGSSSTYQRRSICDGQAPIGSTNGTTTGLSSSGEASQCSNSSSSTTPPSSKNHPQTQTLYFHQKARSNFAAKKGRNIPNSMSCDIISTSVQNHQYETLSIGNRRTKFH